MGRTLKEVIDALPRHRRKRVQARYHELKKEVESRQGIRAPAGVSSARDAKVAKRRKRSA